MCKQLPNSMVRSMKTFEEQCANKTSSTIGNAACAESKSRSVLNAPQEPLLARQQVFPQPDICQDLQQRAPFQVIKAPLPAHVVNEEECLSVLVTNLFHPVHPA
ncbi:hypothetical protein Q5P01_004037 [Channa striata]|uniref:Uncharacterized protein n=1 Tax=Channa striata TaxID=64152 RepID=A0AA88NIN5_CHASR|nr:hypothetical protein Q5P01_004037 [Channa striata]